MVAHLKTTPGIYGDDICDPYPMMLIRVGDNHICVFERNMFKGCFERILLESDNLSIWIKYR